MKTSKCDVCGRTEPDVYCRYNKCKKWGWFRHDDDSQGGSDMEQDLCEKCWKGFQDYMINLNAVKEIDNAKVAEAVACKEEQHRRYGQGTRYREADEVLLSLATYCLEHPEIFKTESGYHDVDKYYNDGAQKEGGVK